MRLSHKKGETRPAVPFILPGLVEKELFHKALACRTRLRILALLEERSMFGYELVRQLGVGQSTVSYHLGILKQARLITTRQQAEGVLCSLAREKREA